MKKAFAAEEGTAVIVTLLALTLVGALGAVMLQTSSSEILIAGSFRDQRSAVYAADAMVSRAIDEIAASADWSVFMTGSRSPTLVDGPASGSRALVDGSTIDLQQVVNMANCQNELGCSAADLDAVTDRRPWGTKNPRWQLYAYGPLASLLPPNAIDLPWYVVLLLADDPLQSDATIALRAEAFGPRKGHAVIELFAARSSDGDTDYNGRPNPVNILSWREVR